MRGLYFLAVLAMLGAANARTTSPLHREVFNSGNLPVYLQGLTPDQIYKEVMAIAGLGNSRSAIDDALRNVLEKVREQFPVGFPVLGIPPLEPLYLQHIAFDLASSLMAVIGAIDETMVTDLSRYIINDVSLDVLRLTLEFNFTYSEINMGGLYDIDGVIAVLPIYGKGPFTLTIHDFDLSGQIKLGINLQGTTYIKEMPMDIHLGSLTNNFENLLGGGAMGQMANQMITDMAPQLVESVKGQLLAPIETLIIEKANAVLSNYTLDELINMILNAGGGKSNK